MASLHPERGAMVLLYTIHYKMEALLVAFEDVIRKQN
jgi:hypothetical protein